MTDMTKTTDAFKTTVWSHKINAGLDKTCVMLQCVNRDYQADADKGTEAINIIVPNDVATGTYTGAITSYGEATADRQQLKLNQNVYFGFSVPDILQAQTQMSIMDTISDKAKTAVECAIDEFLFGHYSSCAPENQIGTVADPMALNKDNVYAHFVKLAKSLKTSGAIGANSRGWAVIHPDVEELLLLCPQFVTASNAGDKTIRDGAIGKIAGLDVLVTNNAGKNSDHYVILTGTNEAITYASQLKTIETVRAQNSFDSIVRGLYTFGALAMNPKALATSISSI